MAPSGSKGDRRAQRDFPSLQTAGRPERDYEAERRSAAENREHRRMAEGFRRVQKAVDEDMDQDGSDMCHILKMLAMAIFSRHNDSTVSFSPEEKLTVVADLVSGKRVSTRLGRAIVLRPRWLPVRQPVAEARRIPVGNEVHRLIAKAALHAVSVAPATA